MSNPYTLKDFLNSREIAHGPDSAPPDTQAARAICTNLLSKPVGRWTGEENLLKAVGQCEADVFSSAISKLRYFDVVDQRIHDDNTGTLYLRLRGSDSYTRVRNALEDAEIAT